MDKQLNMIWQCNILCCAGIAVFTLYERPSIVSLLFYASFFVTATSMWICLHKKVTAYTRGTLVILLLLIMCGLVSVAQGLTSFGYIKKYLIYLTALFSYYISYKMYPTRQTVAVLLGSNVLVSVFYMIRSQAPGAYNGRMLYLFFSNPNFAGMWLCMSMVLLAVTVTLVKSKITKCLLITAIAQLGYLCFQTEARNIWLTLGFALLFCAMCVFSKRDKFQRWIIFGADVFPLLFAGAYLLMIQNDLITEDLTDLVVSEGKTIGSRYGIWIEAFEYIGKRPIFGAYSIVQGGRGSFQLHNTHVDIWAAYGTIGLLLFLTYVYRIMKDLNDSCNSKGAMFALAGFMCMTLMGTAEASVYSNGMGMYIYMSSFLVLANYMNQRKSNEDRISLQSVNSASDPVLRQHVAVNRKKF